MVDSSISVSTQSSPLHLFSSTFHYVRGLPPPLSSQLTLPLLSLLTLCQCTFLHLFSVPFLWHCVYSKKNKMTPSSTMVDSPLTPVRTHLRPLSMQTSASVFSHFSLSKMTSSTTMVDNPPPPPTPLLSVCQHSPVWPLSMQTSVSVFSHFSLSKTTSSITMVDIPPSPRQYSPFINAHLFCLSFQSLLVM